MNLGACLCGSGHVCCSPACAFAWTRRSAGHLESRRRRGSRMRPSWFARLDRQVAGLPGVARTRRNARVPGLSLPAARAGLLAALRPLGRVE